MLASRRMEYHVGAVAIEEVAINARSWTRPRMGAGRLETAFGRSSFSIR
jgi:hypothetical protein